MDESEAVWTPKLSQTSMRGSVGFQRRYRVPGLGCVVSDSEVPRHVRLSGVADRTADRPLDSAQRWQIGSISKAFTAIAVLQLQRARTPVGQ